MISFNILNKDQFAVLTTFRKSGVAVPTTVWFALDGDTIYITTNEQSGKVRRIAHTSTVTLAPSDRVGNIHGPAVDSTARLLPDQEFERARAALQAKYGEIYTTMTAQMDQRPGIGRRVFIAVMPRAETSGEEST